LQYWIQRSLNRFVRAPADAANSQNGPDADGFRIFAASPKSANKITEIIKKAEQDVHEVLMQSQDEATEVRVLLLHHFSAQDF
jgi:hypothetical protein